MYERMAKEMAAHAVRRLLRDSKAVGDTILVGHFNKIITGIENLDIKKEE